MEKKNVIFLSVIAVATLLTAVIGTTFAYFTATVSGNDSATTTEITTANLGVTFTDGPAISLTNVIPVSGTENNGVIGSKTFTIKNTSAVPVVYTIAWKNVTNGFPATNDLKYNLSATTDGSDTVPEAATAQAMPTADDAKLVESVTIAAGATHTYTMDVTFIDNGSPQDEQQNKTFSGVLNVSAVQQTPTTGA